MEASASNKEIELENIERSASDLIISNIKQFVTLRDSAKMYDRKVQRLKKHMSNLVENNHSVERNLDKLEQTVIDIDAKIMTTTKIHVEKKEELVDLQSARSNILRKQWDDRLSEIGNYANSFSQWITEYSRDTLRKDIEDHQKECKKVSDELSILKEEVDNMIRKNNLNYIEANVDIDDLPNFDSVISNIKVSSSKSMQNIKFTQNTLNKIQRKLKQNKIAVNEYKMKEKTNIV